MPLRSVIPRRWLPSPSSPWQADSASERLCHSGHRAHGRVHGARARQRGARTIHAWRIPRSCSPIQTPRARSAIRQARQSAASASLLGIASFIFLALWMMRIRTNLGAIGKPAGGPPSVEWWGWFVPTRQLRIAFAWHARDLASQRWLGPIAWLVDPVLRGVVDLPDNSFRNVSRDRFQHRKTHSP